MFITTDANRADVQSSCGVADLLGCPFVQAPSSSRARRDRRFRRAFLSGIACVQQGPPGLTKVGVSVSCTEGPHTCSKSDISSSKGDAGAQFSRVVRFASFRMQHLDGNTFEFTTGSSPDTNEADHPRGMLSDSGGVVSQALAWPLPDGSSRNRGHADTRHPWQGDHPRVAKHASGDSMAIDTDSSLVACGAILLGAGASASTPQEQLLPHAGTNENILSDASCYSATEVLDAGYAADDDEDIVSGANPLDVVYKIVAGLCCKGIAIGDFVVIAGLEEAVGLNGQRGRVVSCFATTQRFGVELDHAMGCKSVKASNLLVQSNEWADVEAVAAAAAHWNFSFEDVKTAIYNWECLRVLGCDSECTKVRFVGPFLLP